MDLKIAEAPVSLGSFVPAALYCIIMPQLKVVKHTDYGHMMAKSLILCAQIQIQIPIPNNIWYLDIKA
jgi:hypothetical protein